MPYLPATYKSKEQLRKQAERQRQRQADYDSRRLSAYRRGYDDTWKTTRIDILSRKPLCHDCLTNGKYVAATEVHHIKKARDHKELFHTEANLMPLCKSCHSIRTSKGE